jgi:hypothetical protein
MDNPIEQQKEFLKKCVKFFWQNKDLAELYLTVSIDTRGEYNLYFNKNFNIQVNQERVIVRNNLQEVNTFIDENIPLIMKIVLNFKYPVLNGGKNYLHPDGSEELIGYVVYDDGEYFFGCETNRGNIRLKYGLLGKIYRILAKIEAQEDNLKDLTKLQQKKNENIELKEDIKKYENKKINYDQSKLNDRIINLIEFSKLNQKPPPSQQRRSSRHSPGKEVGFYKGMAFGNRQLSTIQLLKRNLKDMLNDPFKHMCTEGESRLIRDLSKFRDTCNDVLKDIESKIKIISDDLGFEGITEKKFNKDILENARLKSYEYITDNNRLKLEKIQSHKLYNERKNLIRNTGDLIKVSTDFTNKKFDYLDKELKKNREDVRRHRLLLRDQATRLRQQQNESLEQRITRLEGELNVLNLQRQQLLERIDRNIRDNNRVAEEATRRNLEVLERVIQELETNIQNLVRENIQQQNLGRRGAGGDQILTRLRAGLALLIRHRENLVENIEREVNPVQRETLRRNLVALERTIQETEEQIIVRENILLEQNARRGEGGGVAGFGKKRINLKSFNLKSLKMDLKKVVKS